MDAPWLDILDAVPLGLVSLDRRGAVLRSNAAARKLGLEAGAVLHELLCGPSGPTPIELSLADGKPRSNTSYRIRNIPVHIYTNGAFVLVCPGCARLREMQDGETRFERLLEAAFDGVLIHDGERILDASERLARMFGYSKQELLGRDPLDLISAESAETARRAIRERLEDPYFAWGMGQGGRKIPIEISGRAIPHGGKTVRAVFMRNLTEEMRARDSLRQSEQRYRSLVQVLPDAILVATGGRWIFSNPAGTALIGDPIGRECGEIADSGHRDALLDLLKQAGDAGRAGPLLATLRGIRTECTAIAIEFEGAAATLLIARNLTEQERLRDQFNQAQKMESVGRLAGGVAHDFNNLLTVINGYAELVLEQADSSHGRAEVEEILKAGRKAASLTRQLLAFSRRQILQPVVADLRAILDDMMKLLRRLVGEDVEIEVRKSADLGCVRVDPGQIEQVVMNLVVNARDAMPRGGWLKIELADAELDAGFASNHPGARIGPHVRLTVRDTGCGMSSEVLAHLFEPFFTTKEQGRGTGLGLSTVYGIVKQSGGYIACESAVGSGTAFDIYLPRVNEEIAEAKEGPESKPVGGHETILLAEDEDSVRHLVTRVLQSKGYNVISAWNGAEGFRIGERYPGPIDLLLTDVVMPEMDGRELARRLSALRPEMKVVFVCGHTEHAALGEGLQEEHLVRKPFVLESLLEKIREVLVARP